MGLHEEHYRKVRKAKSILIKDGIWGAVTFENGLYCFATKQKLGLHGKIDNHPYQDKLIISQDGTKYKFDSICIHYMNGYYYHATILKIGTKSHGTVIFDNINSTDSVVEESVKEFHQKFTFV